MYILPCFLDAPTTTLQHNIKFINKLKSSRNPSVGEISILAQTIASEATLNKLRA